MRDWDINLLEVILNIRAGDPAGWVPALRALEDGGARFIVIVVEPVGTVFRIHGVVVVFAGGHGASLPVYK